MVSQNQSIHAGEVALRVNAITKRFPGVMALDNVDFDLKSGEVHALVGENGAGKSTLIKLLTGALKPDRGGLELFGVKSEWTSARDRRQAGLSAIYQELTTVPEMSAAANVFLDNPHRRGPFLDRVEMRRTFDQLANRLGLSMSANARAGSLSIADRQMIEIMRALAVSARILIMDEPTATLGPPERERLYDVINGLRQTGTGIIYVSHDLDEVLRLSDRITVMRNGAVVRTAPRDEWTKISMVEAMVGDKALVRPPQRRSSHGKVLLGVSELIVPGRVSNISLQVREGEILGIAGLVGSGRSEILRALAGADPTARGRIVMDGQTHPLPATPREAIAAGIVLVPEDRKGQGFIPLMSGVDNVATTDLEKVSRLGWSDRTLRASLAEQAGNLMGFRRDRLHQPMGTLSGGNQQKLVIGKWLHRAPRVLLLDEPTRGVDVGAKGEIYRSIHKLAGEGMAVILVSSELEEVVENADRIAVLAKGEIADVLEGADTNVDRLLSIIFAATEVA